MTNKFRLLRVEALPAALVAGALTAAVSLQHVLGWSPCPLCVLQRLTMLLLLSSLMLFGFTRRPGGWNAVGFYAAAVAAAAGIAAGTAHLWLIFKPQVASCGPGLATFVSNVVEALPGSDWLLKGAGSCGDDRYAILGAPLPAWSLALHATAFLAAWAIRRR